MYYIQTGSQEIADFLNEVVPQQRFFGSRIRTQHGRERREYAIWVNDQISGKLVAGVTTDGATFISLED